MTEHADPRPEAEGQQAENEAAASPTAAEAAVQENAGSPPAGVDGDRQSRRPSPGPSATSRARRAAAAGVQARRPSPRPHPATGGDAEPTATPATEPTATPATEPPATPATEPPATPAPEAAPAEADQPTVATEPAEPAPARRAPLWLAVLLAVLVLAGIVAVVVAARLPSGSGSTGDRDRALSAAKSEVPLILSYDYASFDADVAKAKAQLTGRAVTDYATAMAQTIKPAAVKAKAVVQAQTDGAGVESVSPDGRQVTVVVFGEQKVTNTSLSAPRTDLFRVRATLDLVGGHWLVSKFDQI